MEGDAIIEASPSLDECRRPRPRRRPFPCFFSPPGVDAREPGISIFASGKIYEFFVRIQLQKHNVTFDQNVT